METIYWILAMPSSNCCIFCSYPADSMDGNYCNNYCNLKIFKEIHWWFSMLYILCQLLECSSFWLLLFFFLFFAVIRLMGESWMTWRIAFTDSLTTHATAWDGNYYSTGCQPCHVILAWRILIVIWQVRLETNDYDVESIEEPHNCFLMTWYVFYKY